jgi:hypothetical protein
MYYGSRQAQIVRGGVRTNGLKNGAVDLQHGTGVEESLHPCSEGHYFKESFFTFEDPHIDLLSIVPFSFHTVYFSPLQDKNTVSNVKELQISFYSWAC